SPVLQARQGAQGAHQPRARQRAGRREQRAAARRPRALGRQGAVSRPGLAVERLWSPWRLTYVTGTAADAAHDCVFCEAAVRDRDALVLVRGAYCYVILNLYP